MENAEIVKWIVLTIMGLAVWFLKNTLTKLQSDVEALKENRVHVNDFKDFKIELRSMFDDLRRDIRDMRQNEKS